MNYSCHFCQKETVNTSPEVGAPTIWQDCLNCSNQNINIRYLFNTFIKINYVGLTIFFKDIPYSIDIWPSYPGQPIMMIYHHTKNNIYTEEYSERNQIFSSHNIPNINPATIKEKLKTYLVFL